MAQLRLEESRVILKQLVRARRASSLSSSQASQSSDEKHVYKSVARTIKMLFEQHRVRFEDASIDAFSFFVDECIKLAIIVPELRDYYLKNLQDISNRHQSYFHTFMIDNKNFNMQIAETFKLVVCALDADEQFAQSGSTRKDRFRALLKTVDRMIRERGHGYANELVGVLSQRYEGVSITKQLIHSLNKLIAGFYEARLAALSSEEAYKVVCQFVRNDNKYHYAESPLLDGSEVRRRRRTASNLNEFVGKKKCLRAYVETFLEGQGLADDESAKSVMEKVLTKHEILQRCPKPEKWRFAINVLVQCSELEKKGELPDSLKKAWVSCKNMEEVEASGLSTGMLVIQLKKKIEEYLKYHPLGVAEDELFNLCANYHVLLKCLLEEETDWSEQIDIIARVDQQLSEKLEMARKANGADILSGSFALLAHFESMKPQRHNLFKNLLEKHNKAQLSLCEDSVLRAWLLKYRSGDGSTAELSADNLNFLLWQAITISPVDWSNTFKEVMRAICELLEHPQSELQQHFSKLATPRRFLSLINWLVALSNGDVTEVKFDLYLPANLQGVNLTQSQLSSQCNSDGSTLLHHLAKWEYTEVIKSALCNLSKEEILRLLTMEDNFGNTVLHYVATLGYAEVMNVILNAISGCLGSEKLAVLAASNNKKMTMMHYAARGGYVELVSSILNALQEIQVSENENIEVHKVIANGLIIAAFLGQTEVVRVILSMLPVQPKAQIMVLTAKNANRYTALFYAVKKGHVEIVHALLSALLERRGSKNEMSIIHGHIKYALFFGCKCRADRSGGGYVEFFS